MTFNLGYQSGLLLFFFFQGIIFCILIFKKSLEIEKQVGLLACRICFTDSMFNCQYATDDCLIIPIVDQSLILTIIIWQ